MRTLILALIVLAPAVGEACMIAEVLDPACERDPDSCVRRDLKQMYERADVVYEITVQSADSPFLGRRGRIQHSVHVRHAWKTDGGVLDIVEAGSGGGDCTVRLSVGVTYLVFAHRLSSNLAFLPWVKEPLYAGITRTFTPDAFSSTSAHHAALYDARNVRSLQIALDSLAR
jgi:hypothetical protein